MTVGMSTDKLRNWNFSTTKTQTQQSTVRSPSTEDYDKQLWSQIQGLNLSKNLPLAESMLKSRSSNYTVMKKEIDSIQQDILQLRRKLDKVPLTGQSQQQSRIPLSRLISPRY